MVTLSDAAKPIWGQFYNSNAVELHTLDCDAGRAAWAKLPGYAARIALVLHVVEYLEGSALYDIPSVVSAQTLEAAIRLVEWFKGESLRLLSTFCNQPLNVDREAAAILGAIHKKGTVGKEDLHGIRVFRNASKPSETIDAKLAELCSCGEIVSDFVKDPNGGCGKYVYRLPMVDSGSGTIVIPGEYGGCTATASDTEAENSHSDGVEPADEVIEAMETVELANGSATVKNIGNNEGCTATANGNGQSNAVVEQVDVGSPTDELLGEYGSNATIVSAWRSRYPMGWCEVPTRY
jgi:hypothetical protein